METIINPGFEKIMKLFYSNKKEGIHLRDIARKTKLNENSTSRFLNKLENLGLLTSKKDGNLKKYYVKNNDLCFLLFTYFDLSRFNDIESLRRNAISYFLERLNEKPIICLLFGSTATGDYNSNSDIDILLIVNKKMNTEDAEKYSESQTGIRIQCFQINYADFLNESQLKKDKVIMSALTSGFPISNHIKFYQETLK